MGSTSSTMEIGRLISPLWLLIDDCTTTKTTSLSFLGTFFRTGAPSLDFFFLISSTILQGICIDSSGEKEKIFSFGNHGSKAPATVLLPSFGKLLVLRRPPLGCCFGIMVIGPFLYCDHRGHTFHAWCTGVKRIFIDILGLWVFSIYLGVTASGYSASFGVVGFP
jgi:hypothetical protein